MIRLERYEAMTTARDSLRGRIAVVTGGAGAIGTAITKALQEAGHRTVVLDRDADIACDLGSEASTRAAAAAVLERYGRCDVFVHCAAAFDQVTLSDVDAATWRHVQAVNVESAPGAVRRRRAHHEVAGTVPPPLGQGDGKSGQEPAHSRLSVEDRFCGAIGSAVLRSRESP